MSTGRSASSPVSLVIPPSPFLADERVFPFIGVLKVASVLEAAGVPVDILDCSGYANYQDLLLEYLDQHRDMDWFGITATTPQLPNAVELLHTIREQRPQARVTVGGPHATLTTAAWKMDQEKGLRGRGSIAYDQLTSLFDCVVAGDGEEAVFRALGVNQPQLIDADDLHSDLFLKRGSLEDFPYPARQLIDLASYHYTIDGHPATSLIGQLGCPFKCGFCGGRDAASFRFIRTRRPEHIAQEIRHLHSVYGYTGYMFYDDELNVTPRGLEDLCGALIALQDELGTEMRFRGFVKAELFTERQAAAMYKAGFRVLLSGVESGSDRILAAMEKRTTAEINSRCLRLARDAGMEFKALMSIGHPGESRRTVVESVEWVLREQPNEVDWTVITQYPGSPYFDHSVRVSGQRGTWVYETRAGELLYSREVDYTREAEFYKGVSGSYVSYVWTPDLSADTLVWERDEAERVTRAALGMPPIQSIAAEQFEHSMGQGLLPARVLRSTRETMAVSH